MCENTVTEVLDEKSLWEQRYWELQRRIDRLFEMLEKTLDSAINPIIKIDSDGLTQPYRKV